VRSDIEFVSQGDTVRGWFLTPDEAEAPFPAIAMAGGWCYVKELVQPHYARFFVDAGFAVLLFDYRNFGASDGARRQHIDPTMQIEDYRNAISYLEVQEDVDPVRIGVWGLSYSGVLAPDGELKNSTASDTIIARGLSQVLANFRDFYPGIPAGGLTLNAAWIDTTSRTDRAGIFDRVTVTTIARSRAAAIEELAGAHAIRLEVDAILAITGAGNQGGQDLDLAGKGTRHATEYVAVDGRFLGGESLDSTDLEIAVPAQGQVVSIKQIAKSIVQVLP